MEELLPPLVRIILRYAGGALITAGYAHSPDTFTDPDLVQVVCFVAGVVSSVMAECWYTLARCRGWRC